MPPAYKRVPAIDRCFAILDLLAQSQEPLGISSISSNLRLNKSTVFNIVHTLAELGVLECHADGKFGFGTRFYMLGEMTGKRSALIRTAHPYLQKINENTKLSAFLGIRADVYSVLIDKVDSAYGIKVSSEIGLRMPALAGAGIKAMLSQLPDAEIEEILARTELKRYTPYSITKKAVYKKEILEVRRQGVAYDREEYIEGMVAFAIPVRGSRKETQAAIWAVGLSHQVPGSSVEGITDLLKEISREIRCRLQ
jgi:DNA-binding IclR family transcriptional regulator